MLEGKKLFKIPKQDYTAGFKEPAVKRVKDGQGTMRTHMGSTHKAHAYALMIAFMLGIPHVASAGPFEDGTAAYERGEYATALKLWQPLANQGNAGAQVALGVMFYNGQNVPQDYAEAVKWFRLAANRGYAGAQSNLGVMYINGRGVPQDYVEAHKWLNLAGAGGDKNAAQILSGVEGNMTREQIAEAQRRAAAWKPTP